MDTSKTFVDLGLVSGDTVFVVTDEDIPPQAPVRPQLLTSHNASVCHKGSHSEETVDSSEKQQNVQVINKQMDIDENESEIAHSSACGSANIQNDHIDPVIVNRYLNEPMLCSESTNTRVPAILSHLYSSVCCQDHMTALCVVVNALMLESGYCIPVATETIIQVKYVYICT